MNIVALYPIIAGSVSGGVCGLISIYVTDRLKNKDRQLDVYKMLYTEKLTAAKKLMELATKMRREAWIVVGRRQTVAQFRMMDPDHRGSESAIGQAADQEAKEAEKSIFDTKMDIAACIDGSRWLLGDEVFRDAHAYVEHVFKAVVFDHLFSSDDEAMKMIAPLEQKLTDSLIRSMHSTTPYLLKSQK